jgi:regulator of replication initiation timing
VDIIYALLSPVLTIVLLWFWKPWASAYAGEKGKNIARKEDLDLLRAEVHATTQVAEQIKVELQASLAARERQMKWRLDVYMEGVGAISRLVYLFARATDIDLPDSEVFSSLAEDIGQLARIDVIASDDMISAIKRFVEKFLTELNSLTVERVLLRAQIKENVIEEKAAAIRRLALLKRSVEVSNALGGLMIPALVAVRKELDLQFDVDRYTQESMEMLQHMRVSSEAALEPFESMVNEMEQ